MCIAVWLVLLAGHFDGATPGPGDKNGGSILADARNRAFLLCGAVGAGPASLSLPASAVDIFTVLAENVAPNRPAGSAALTVSNDARCEIAGKIGPTRCATS